MNNKLWPRLIQLLVVLSIPVFLLVADLRIVTGHWFVRWEYGKADFPPDPFGLSAAERTRLAEVCVDYLATNANLSLLGNYLLGFRVSWGGALLGLAEAALGGFALGYAMARAINGLVGRYEWRLRRRLELERVLDPLEQAP